MQRRVTPVSANTASHILAYPANPRSIIRIFTVSAKIVLNLAVRTVFLASRIDSGMEET